MIVTRNDPIIPMGLLEGREWTNDPEFCFLCGILRILLIDKTKRKGGEAEQNLEYSISVLSTLRIEQSQNFSCISISQTWNFES